MSNLADVGPWVWLDGPIVTLYEARVAVTDHGLVVGDGAFETIPVFDGRPFAISRHLARLRRSLAGLGLACPFGDEALRDAVTAVIAANAPRADRVRLTATGGDTPFGSERVGNPVRVIIGSTAAIERSPVTPVVTVPWPRNERSVLVGLKTTSYAENVVALAHARERGASEALFANTRDELCEGTGSNIFLVVEGQLVTPALSSGCLAGITRELVMGLTGAVERSLPMATLHIATEVFLTSSTRDVQAVSRIDDRELQVGTVTAKAQAAFSDLVAMVADP